MKVCIVCRALKPIDQFNKNSAKRDGVQDRCRPCDNERARAYYKANGERQRQQIHAAKQARRIGVRKFIVEYLREHPCVDCGEVRLVALDFDHVRGKKCFNVSAAPVEGMRLDLVVAEIAKCEVRCANCHRVETARRNPLHWSHSLVDMSR